MIERPDSTSRKRIAWYAFTVFTSSAILLVLEIVAGRLIAPYVGVSLYSWTAIIGVILAGLSIGNWLGGLWADRNAGQASAGIALGLAGLFALASLLILTLVAPVLQGSRINLISASFLYVFALFFIPSLLLGIITPLLTTLALRLDSRAGHIVGRMHALAALGSILGTFATGFWLVQYFGTHKIIIGSAVCLFLLAAPYFRGTPRLAPVIIVMAAIGVSAITYARNGFASPCDRESNYFCIRVVDASGMAPFGTARALVLDHLLHGINHSAEPRMMITPYVHLMDELVLLHFGGEKSASLKYFFAGGGAYTHPRAIRAYTPGARVTVAELDKTVTEMAQQQLFVDTTGMRIIHQDARVVLESLNEESFDVIITDVFHDISVPYHLVTREFAQLVRDRLTPDGLYAVNIVDAETNPLLVKSLVKTLASIFAEVDVWMESGDPPSNRITYVVTAGQRVKPSVIKAQRGFERTWYKHNHVLRTQGTAYEALPLMTDAFVPVERMIATLLLTPEN